jgi:hypothetical protein
VKVIDKNLVYHKSAKGAEAIASRQHGLGPRLRSTLIMVDGKRSFDELAKFSVSGDTENVLSQLLDQGFIEALPAQSSAPAPLASAAAVPDRPGVTLLEAQRFVSHRLTDLLGPNAEELCLRIEGTKNVHDFQVAVARAEGLLRQFRSAQTAADFAAEAQAHMPAG